MKLSETCTKIKSRNKPNDIFITPLELAKFHIETIEHKENDIWYDPFKNSGSYFNQFPTENKKWSEILENKDFFDFHEKIDVICSNPPYSCIDDILKKSVELNPRVISYLIGINNLTTRRIEFMNKAGYGLVNFHMTKIYKWFGFSLIITFEKNKENKISYDRKVWRT